MAEFRWPRSVVPDGTWLALRLLPTVETVGYGLASLMGLIRTMRFMGLMGIIGLMVEAGT